MATEKSEANINKEIVKSKRASITKINNATRNQKNSYAQEKVRLQMLALKFQKSEAIFEIAKKCDSTFSLLDSEK